MLTTTQMIGMLNQAGVRPSVHRLAVLEYVANRQTHPTADEIYQTLSVDFPKVSRTTIYNSLHALVEAHLLKELDIESGNTHYDLAPQNPHSHFRCARCGNIFDMGLPTGLDSIVNPGFLVETTELYFSGICPRCAEDSVGKQ